MTKNNLSAWIEHSVKRELYGNISKEDAVELINILYEKLLKILKRYKYIGTKTEYNLIIKELEKLLAEYKADYKELLEGQIKIISEVESTWIKDFMSELGRDFVIPATILSSLRFSPVANSTNYEQLIESSVTRIKQSVDSSLKVGYLTKNDMSDVSERIINKSETEINNVSKDVEVFNTTSFSMTDYLMFKANKEKVKYISILDSRTCLSCSSFDGQEFNITSAPLLPMHYNCRCILVPVELEGDYESYSAWFEEQSEDVQKEVLGKTRYKLYKENGIKITEFVNDGQLIPLKSLNFSKK